MKWNLYENKKYLKPLCFSNGKTQEDVVKEILELIKKGRRSFLSTEFVALENQLLPLILLVIWEKPPL